MGKLVKVNKLSIQIKWEAQRVRENVTIGKFCRSENVDIFSDTQNNFISKFKDWIKKVFTTLTLETKVRTIWSLQISESTRIISIIILETITNIKANDI